jgi:hypothetical protein
MIWLTLWNQLVQVGICNGNHNKTLKYEKYNSEDSESKWSSGSFVTTMWICNTCVDQRRFLPFIANDVPPVCEYNRDNKSNYLANGLYQVYRKKNNP